MNDYEQLYKKYGLIGPQVGKNEDGEYVVVTITDESAVVTTSQKNGWLRINTYYKNGICTEEYEK